MGNNNKPTFKPGDHVWCIDADNLYGPQREFQSGKSGLYPNSDLTEGHQYVISRCEPSGATDVFGSFQVRLANKQWTYRGTRFSKEPHHILPTPDWSLDDLELAQMEIEEIDRAKR